MDSPERERILRNYREHSKRFDIIANKLDHRARIHSSAAGPDIHGMPASSPPLPLVPWVALTSREVEVMDLVAQGFGNSEIGERLIISSETVKSHVQHTLRKIGARNRAHAVALILEQRSTLPRAA